MKATLTVDKTTVAEGGSVTYTVTLTNAAGMPMASHGELTFTLTDGTVVKIPANGTTGSCSITAKDDIFWRRSGQSSTSWNRSGQQLREADPRPGPIHTTVTDEPSGQGDKITITIESNGDVLENAAPSSPSKWIRN